MEIMVLMNLKRRYIMNNLTSEDQGIESATAVLSEIRKAQEDNADMKEMNFSLGDEMIDLKKINLKDFFNSFIGRLNEQDGIHAKLNENGNSASIQWA